MPQSLTAAYWTRLSPLPVFLHRLPTVPQTTWLRVRRSHLRFWTRASEHLPRKRSDRPWALRGARGGSSRCVSFRTLRQPSGEAPARTLDHVGGQQGRTPHISCRSVADLAEIRTPFRCACRLRSEGRGSTASVRPASST